MLLSPEATLEANTTRQGSMAFLMENDMTTYEKHRFNIYPEADKDDLQYIIDDMQANGYDERQPIYLYDGAILDGWNRYRASQKASVEPVTETFEGTDSEAIAFMARTNKRRNLNSWQKATIAAEAEELLASIAEAQPKGGRPAADEKPRQTFAEVNPDENKTSHQAASMFGTNRTYLNDAKKLKEESPEQFEAAKRGDYSYSDYTAQKKKKKKNNDREQRKQSQASAARAMVMSNMADWVSVSCDSVNQCRPNGVNVIITDPPYPKEYIGLYEELAKSASEILPVGGLCVAMAGQSYLPEIMQSMAKHLCYRWTCAYLTPGGQAVQVWPRKVNTFWKPLLVFSNGEMPDSSSWIGDVTKSDVNDNDKNHHHWGQSVSGMVDVVSRFSKPEDVVFDPFIGAGTTGIACVLSNRKIVGCDIDEQFVNKANERIAEAWNECA